MIGFVSNRDIIAKVIDKYSNISILNFSGVMSGYESVTDLVTCMNKINLPEGINIPEYVSMPEFDIQYANLILSDARLFYNFMKIMLPVNNGNSVILLVYRDWFRDSLMESIIKMIQQRYGYKCWIINDENDIESIPITEQPTTEGILNMDADIAKYESLINSGMFEDFTRFKETMQSTEIMKC